jgi:seryl-tRNA synthetase
MWNAERVVDALRSRGELWEPGPGLVGLRGDALVLFRRLATLIDASMRREREEEWRIPPALSLHALQRADYFASFPQWLTMAAHLGGGATALERIAAADDPAAIARTQLAPAEAALQPAACYHVYDALAGATLDATRIISVEGTCWRHESKPFEPLARGWAFTMREQVCIGDDESSLGFREDGCRRALLLAASLGIPAQVVEASDPFFAPTGRGRAALQRIKSLKHELLLPTGPNEAVAAASFNLHERFFGNAFEIALADGSPASTACVAFGLERWLLAFLVEHGPHAARWPWIEHHGASAGALP